jgi:flagellar hook-length control protein FliK
VASQATGDAVADQVSYFVSQGIQNAELTLDGLNAERVEVKISMSGKEAHVEFRSDQLATREMLAGTTAHLRDLLSSQGVVLTGVTVGQSGADFTGGQQPQGRSREGQAQGRGTAGESRTVAAVAPAAAKAPAGTLDLFV